MKNLFKILGINENLPFYKIDSIYKNLDKKDKQKQLAWKILRDKFYNSIYKKYQSLDKVYQAGFINDNIEIENIDFYKTNILTTPYNKILDNINENTINPIVLLSTGGFYPIHQGHIDMMELAKQTFNNNGFNVVGGYLSLSHDDYIKTKPFYNTTSLQRLDNAQKIISDSSWLMIDPFESLWAPTYINFTDVITRLEKYLQKYVDKKIKVAYVCGDDNVNFMYCFEKYGFGVCVSRNNLENFKLVKEDLKNNKNIFFVDNIKNTKQLSSRQIRNGYMCDNFKNYTGNYLIRDEELLPLKKFLKYKSKDELKNIQKETILEFKSILDSTFNSKINIEIIKVKDQIKKANKQLSNKNTISLDSYFIGTYNIEISRLFEISDKQLTYTKLVSRNNKNINDEINKIIPNNYTLVDDDSVSGNTLRSIFEQIPDTIKINSIYLLMDHKNIFDVVDFRDFIIGANNAGLMTRLSNNLIIRVPYIYPYVNLNTRANIPLDKEIEFTINILDLNINFFNKIDKSIKLKDVDNNFIHLMKFIGFSENDYIIDILKWHKKNLKK